MELHLDEDGIAAVRHAMPHGGNSRKITLRKFGLFGLAPKLDCRKSDSRTWPVRVT
jgi:hypothetical protein